MTATELQAFFKARPGVFKSYIPKRLNISRQYFGQWLNGQRPIPEKYHQQIKLIMREYGYETKRN